jgi:hypothetical protein
MLASSFVTAAVLAFSIAAVSFTVTRTVVFESFRNWVGGAATDETGHKVVYDRPFLFKLCSCPYCLSHYLSFGAVIIYRPRLVHLFYPLDLLVTAFAMIAFTMLVVGLMTRAFKA